MINHQKVSGFWSWQRRFAIEIWAIWLQQPALKCLNVTKKSSLQDDAASTLAAPSRRSLHFRDYQLQRQNSVSPATGCVAAFPFPMMKQNKLENLPSTSPLEKLYRYMWRRKVLTASLHHMQTSLANTPWHQPDLRESDWSGHQDATVPDPEHDSN